MKSVENKRNGKLHYAWMILLGVILIRGFAGGGINMTSALFLAPVSEELGVGIGTLSLYFSITSIVMIFWLPYAGRLINRYDIRIMAAVGAALMALSFAGFGFLNGVYGWYLLAIPQAMGATILVSLMGPILINRWFARNAGLMMGIQMAFVGMFGAVFQPVVSGMIARDGWRAGYFRVGLVTFLVVILSALLLLRNNPEESGMLPYGEGVTGRTGKRGGVSGGKLEISEKTAIRSASFYCLLFFMIALTGVGVFTQHIPTFGTVSGYTLKQTGAILSFSSIGNAVGSILIGLISDRIGCLKTAYGIILIGLAAVTGFFFGADSYLVFGAATFLHGLVSSSIMVLAPVLTVQFYGQKDYEKIYAKISMGAPLASIVLIPVYGFIYDRTRNYGAVLAGIAVLLVIALFCIIYGWKKRCTKEGCPGFRDTSK